MSIARNKGVPIMNSSLNFSSSQWEGIKIAGLVAASLSFAANIGVILIHITLTCIRPYIVNRLSLRMILISCICNFIFCICQLVTDHVSSVSKSCRSFAYVLIASDTMACMCLAMVSLNLVMIFVLKVPKTIKIEIVYYFIVAASGILVTVVPLYVGTPKGPRNSNELATCWYHYYFEGRMNNIFNWMYYYGWVMFSIVIAALFAVISIRFVGKRQKNFTGVLNIFSSNKKDGSSIALIRKYTKDTDVFLKIAKRCTLYSLIPLICKSWGVGIEIGAAVKAKIPFAIFLLDRLFSCLLGFMVGCLYFSDPAIIACFKYYADLMKHNYVYNYFLIKYQPIKDSSVGKGAQYPQSMEVELIRDMNPNVAIDGTAQYPTNTVVAIAKEDSHFSVDRNVQVSSQTEATGVTSQIYDTPVLTVIEGGCFIATVTKYKIVKVTSLNGNNFVPTERSFDPSTESERQCIKRDNVHYIPMYRNCEDGLLNNTSTGKNHVRNSYIVQGDNENIEELIRYDCPTIARLMHWTLTTLFGVKSKESHDLQEANQRRRLTMMFDSFKDPTQENKTDQEYQLETRSFRRKTLDGNASASFHSVKYDDHAPTMALGQAIYTSHLDSHAESSGSNRPQDHQTKTQTSRKASISLGVLTREKSKQKASSIAETSSVSSSNYDRTMNPSALKKMLDKGRIMSKNWNRFATPKGKSPPSLFNNEEDAFGNSEIQQQNTPHQETSPSNQEIAHHQNDAPFVEYEQLDYPRELSPRPQSNHKTPKTLTESSLQTALDLATKSTASLEEEISIHNSTEGVSPPPEQDNSGASPLFVDRENTSDTSSHHTQIRVVKPKKPQRMQITYAQDNLKYGHTVVTNISNWQGPTAFGEDRIVTISESWDLEEQLREQMKM